MIPSLQVVVKSTGTVVREVQQPCTKFFVVMETTLSYEVEITLVAVAYVEVR